MQGLNYDYNMNPQMMMYNEQVKDDKRNKEILYFNKR